MQIICIIYTIIIVSQLLQNNTILPLDDGFVKITKEQGWEW
jgi:hypothetical protein